MSKYDMNATEVAIKNNYQLFAMECARKSTKIKYLKENKINNEKIVDTSKISITTTIIWCV